MKTSSSTEPLTDYEAILFYRLVHQGTGGYPIGQNKKDKRFFVSTFITRETFDSYRSATEAVEKWTEETSERFKEMKRNHPGLRLEADGIHFEPDQDMGMETRPGPEPAPELMNLFDLGGDV